MKARNKQDFNRGVKENRGGKTLQCLLDIFNSLVSGGTLLLNNKYTIEGGLGSNNVQFSFRHLEFKEI